MLLDVLLFNNFLRTLKISSSRFLFFRIQVLVPVSVVVCKFPCMRSLVYTYSESGIFFYTYYMLPIFVLASSRYPLCWLNNIRIIIKNQFQLSTSVIIKSFIENSRVKPNISDILQNKCTCVQFDFKQIDVMSSNWKN